MQGEGCARAVCVPRTPCMLPSRLLLAVRAAGGCVLCLRLSLLLLLVMLFLVPVEQSTHLAAHHCRATRQEGHRAQKFTAVLEKCVSHLCRAQPCRRPAQTAPSTHRHGQMLRQARPAQCTAARAGQPAHQGEIFSQAEGQGQDGRAQCADQTILSVERKLHWLTLNTFITTIVATRPAA